MDKMTATESKLQAHAVAIHEAADAITQIAALPPDERVKYADTIARSSKILEAAGCWIRRNVVA
jgi:hypothetical protein